MSQKVSARGRAAALTAVLLVLWMPRSLAQNPIKVSSVDDFRSAMESIGDAFEIIEGMTRAPVFLLNSARGDGLTRARIIQRNLVGARGFFADRAKPDGVKLADEALAVLSDVETELGRATPDQASAMDAVADLATRCAACHSSYREGTAETGYRFKRGAL